MKHVAVPRTSNNFQGDDGIFRQSHQTTETTSASEQGNNEESSRRMRF